MGIDVYLQWPGMTKDERARQFTGYNTTSGHVGYLREAYHGEPYATMVLVPEGWKTNRSGGVPIKASVLAERLSPTLDAHVTRSRVVYKKDCNGEGRCCKAFVDFVELAERMERRTGKPCRVMVSY